MNQPLDKLKNRVLRKKNAESTELTDLMIFAKDLGCIGDILGRKYEVFDKKGKLQYTIKQKPMAIKQLNLLLKELAIVKKMEADAETKKWGSKGSRRKK